MKSFILVLKFELGTMLKKKSFVISTVLVVLGAFVLLSLPRFFMGEEGTSDSTGSSEATSGEASREIMMLYDENHVLSQSALAEAIFPEYEITFANSVNDLESAIMEERAACGFVIHHETDYTYYVKNSSLMDSTSERFAQLLQKQYQYHALAELNYDAARVDEIYGKEITSDMNVLGTDGLSNYFYTYVLIFILYMMILIYGNQIGVGVASEKSNRAIEILTTSCSPNALIFGKVIAGAIAGMLQTALMIGGVLAAYYVNADSLQHMLDPYLNIPPLVLVTFALFGVLGYLLFSFLFGAIGAMCSKLEEVNGATMPIQLLIIAVFMLSIFTLSAPDTLLSQITMYLPFTSWMCMFVNVAVGSVSMLQITISLAILALTTLGMGFLGARLYRRGTLTYGNSLQFKNIVRVLKHKD